MVDSAGCGHTSPLTLFWPRLTHNIHRFMHVDSFEIGNVGTSLGGKAGVRSKCANNTICPFNTSTELSCGKFYFR